MYLSPCSSKNKTAGRTENKNYIRNHIKMLNIKYFILEMM